MNEMNQQTQTLIRDMAAIRMLAMITFCGLSLLGCGDREAAKAVRDVAIQAKGAITGEQMPETSVDSALANHGPQQILTWAQAGQPKAQHFAALLYLGGKGIPKNFDNATTWARRAANSGLPVSQFLLGEIYADEAINFPPSHQSEVAFIRAYMWYSLAAANGHKQAAASRDKIQDLMLSDWVSRAQSMAGKWVACNSSDCWDKEPALPPSAACLQNPGSTECMLSKY